MNLKDLVEEHINGKRWWDIVTEQDDKADFLFPDVQGSTFLCMVKWGGYPIAYGFIKGHFVGVKFAILVDYEVLLWKVLVMHSLQYDEWECCFHNPSSFSELDRTLKKMRRKYFANRIWRLPAKFIRRSVFRVQNYYRSRFAR